MYRPRDNKPKMKGGDYATIVSTPGTISDISISTLQYIMTVANITSIDAITTLTLDQLSTMTRAIDKQISEDQAEIALNNISIATLSLKISEPGGLQAMYDTADQQYRSTLSVYNLTSSFIVNSKNELTKDMKSLTNLYELSSLYVSSLNSYESEYNLIVSTLTQYESTINIYQQSYKETLLKISTNKVLCDSSYLNMKALSTIITSSEYQATDLNSFYNYSSQTVNCKMLDSEFENDIAQIFNNISSIMGISTFKVLALGNYLSSIEYYQTLENKNMSLISEYLNEISSYTRQINAIDAENKLLSSGLQDEMQTITASASSFYKYLQSGLESECDEVMYGVEEYNSQVGFIIASLGIAINANSVAIDNYTFNLLDTTLTTDARSNISNLKGNLLNDNTGMTIIISALNSLDSQFSNIVSNIGVERVLKNSFITERYSIFTNYEVPALGYTKTKINSIKTEYLNKFLSINQIVTSINSQISSRKTGLKYIYDITDEHKTNINSFFRKYLNIVTDQLPINLTRVLDTTGEPLGMSVMLMEPSDPLSNSVYAFLPPINF